MGGCSATPWTAGKKKKREHEWEELGRRVEARMMDEVQSWGAAEDDVEPEEKTEGEKEWEEIGRKVEAKIKRKLEKWAEEE